MKFKFVECTDPRNQSRNYGYLLVIESEEQLLKWWKIHVDSEIKNTSLDFHNHIKNYGYKHFDHYTDKLYTVVHSLASLKNKSLIISKETFHSTLNDLMNDKIKGMVKVLQEKGKVYISKNGSYMFAAKEVSQPIFKDDCDFNVGKDLENRKYTKDDFNITRWPGGKHYYGKVGQQPIEGEKRKTVQAAEDACIELMNQLNSEKGQNEATVNYNK